MFATHIREDLYHCLKCAMCQAVCPTYLVTRMERYAPRGRVQMVRKYLEGDLGVSPGLREALTSCMLCESCAGACPSGVRLNRVFENMRMELHENLGESLPKRALFHALKHPLLMRLGAKVGRMGQKGFLIPLNVSWKLGNIPVTRFQTFNSVPFRKTAGPLASPQGTRTGRVIYFTGCATDLVNEDVGAAVIKVLNTMGVEVIVPQDQVCCSVPVFLSGARREALANVHKNLAVLDQSDVDAIVVDCATCGGALKTGIPHLLEDLGLDTEKALRVAAKVRDVTEIVAERLADLELRDMKQTTTVTYHDPCHLSRTMRISRQPRDILRAMQDVRLVEMTASDQCCGGAGAFQFEHPEISAEVTALKKSRIRDTHAQVVATGCPGCRLTLAGNLNESGDPIVVHTVQLLAERLIPSRFPKGKISGGNPLSENAIPLEGTSCKKFLPTNPVPKTLRTLDGSDRADGSCELAGALSCPAVP
ncbi:MAG: (Fe-S)-binding protein [Thermodesulfobacteriota bacterium]